MIYVLNLSKISKLLSELNYKGINELFENFLFDTILLLLMMMMMMVEHLNKLAKLLRLNCQAFSWVE
ncbi:hypothetical protein T4D_6635 [Trichinella pseudospiralis]|uniref:Uncharacterized protein n=1 Tax=Trichinella pseudospiralis TaxID=6337 RepID=A0A0V1FZR7_TRIPS|nr:hypothetical protein T4D_6635 [Trichinella pseudospiralis]